MAHTLIVGTTESGKTTLATRLSTQYQKQGYKIIVLDPNLSQGWGKNSNVFVTFNREDFLQVFRNSQKCMVFVDESGETVGQHDTGMQWIVTRGRHLGHKVHIIAQRAKQVHPNVRNNCSELFCFSQAPNDAAELAIDFIDDDIARQAPGLPQGHYLKKLRFKPLILGRLW